MIDVIDKVHFAVGVKVQFACEEASVLELTWWCRLEMLDMSVCCCPQTYEEEELLRLVYFGGVEASLRKEVWPFLLGHYQFGMSEDERNEVLPSPLVQLPTPSRR